MARAWCRRASKQFTELDGVPILIHTLRKFAASPQVREIYLALRPPEAAAFQARLSEEKLGKPVRVVEGGEHRQESVANALAAVKAAADDIVLVHDAVRPFVDEEIIASVIEAAARHGAAIAGVPAVDTIKQVERTAEGAVIRATIPRAQIVMAQTPQGFRYERVEESVRRSHRGWIHRDRRGVSGGTLGARSGGGDGLGAQHQDHHAVGPGAGGVFPETQLLAFDALSL